MKQRLRDLEARDNWIAARIDELLADDEWILTVSDDWSDNAIDYATLQAERDYAEIEAMILDAQIDNLELK